jgi:hypothetical protein
VVLYLYFSCIHRVKFTISICYYFWYSVSNFAFYKSRVYLGQKKIVFKLNFQLIYHEHSIYMHEIKIVIIPVVMHAMPLCVAKFWVKGMFVIMTRTTTFNLAMMLRENWDADWKFKVPSCRYFAHSWLRFYVVVVVRPRLSPTNAFSGDDLIH